MTNWYDIEPRDAGDLDLSVRLDIYAPHNEMGERCPWPWDPQQLGGAPLGQYHCGYCGAAVMAGMRHIDYGPSGIDNSVTAVNVVPIKGQKWKVRWEAEPSLAGAIVEVLADPNSDGMVKIQRVITGYVPKEDLVLRVDPPKTPSPTGQELAP